MIISYNVICWGICSLQLLSSVQNFTFTDCMDLSWFGITLCVRLGPRWTYRMDRQVMGCTMYEARKGMVARLSITWWALCRGLHDAWGQEGHGGHTEHRYQPLLAEVSAHPQEHCHSGSILRAWKQVQRMRKIM